MPLAPIRDPQFDRREAISSGARLRAASVYSCIAGGFCIAAILPTGIHPGWALGAGCGCIALAVLGWKRWFLGLLALSLMSLAVGYYQSRVQWQSGDSLTQRINAAAAENATRAAILRVRGKIASNPRLAPHQGPPLGQFLHQVPAARCVMKVEEIEGESGWEKAAGKLWVRVELPPGSTDVSLVKARAGDQVEVVGLARGLRPAQNPGDFDATDWAEDHAFAGSISLSGPDLISELSGPAGVIDRVDRGYVRFKEGLTTRAQDALGKATAGFGEREQSLVMALVLGDNPTDQTLNQAFLRLGLAHVLAISGFHLVVMVQLFLVLIRLTGDRGRIETLLAILLIISYMLIVPAQAPIVRSGWACLALLGAEWLGRRYDTVTLLIWISAALIVVHPTDLWSLGYQLSCGLTILLIWLGQHARDTLFVPRIRGIVRPTYSMPQKIGHFAVEHWKGLVATTLLCSLVSVPLIAARTGTVSPLVLVATIVIVPPITVLLWIAFLALVAGVISPGLAEMLSPVLKAVSEMITWLLGLVDRLPLTHFRVVRPDYAWAMLATIVVIAWFVRRRRKDRVMWAATMGLVLWAGGEWGWHAYRESQRYFRIDMLEVGDGSCLILRSKGKTVLWDAGSLRPGMGSDTIIHALTELDITHLDGVYITHPDLDHFGGLPAVITAFGVRDVFTCERFLSQTVSEPAGSAATLRRIAEEEGCRFHAVREEDGSEFGNVSFSVLSPPTPEPDWKVDNDHSVVVLVRGGGRQLALLTGDLQEQGLSRLMAARRDLDPAVLELMHHGSYKPAALAFVMEMKPEVVLQSTSQKREGDARWAPAREKTKKWYTTSADGASFVEFAGDGTWRSGHYPER